MSIIPIEEAEGRLSDLVAHLMPGDEILLTRNDQPIAKLTSVPQPRRQPRLGTLKGTVLYMAPDFDAPLEDFKRTMAGVGTPPPVNSRDSRGAAGGGVPTPATIR